MKTSKKSETIQVRMTFAELQVLDRSAQLFGLSRSEYVRRTNAEGGKVLMRERMGRLVDAKHGRVYEIKTDSDHTYYVGNAVYKTRNHVVIFDAEYRMVGRKDVQGDHLLLKEIFAVVEGHDNFDGPAYRSLFEKLGLDPDRGRAKFNAADHDVVKLLEWKNPWPGDDGRNTHHLTELANDISELLRIDQDPDLETYFKCQDALEQWSYAVDKAAFQGAFDRVNWSRLTSTAAVAVEIDILSSWSGLTDHRLIEPRLYLDMWSRVFGHDDQGFPDSWPKTFTGIAVEPNMHSENDPRWEFCSSWYKVWDLGAQRARDRLEQQGVLVLSKGDAVKYVLSDEAVYWRWKQRNDRAWDNPSFAHLKPRAPTWPERTRWRFRKPETPLYDRFCRQVASAA